MTTHPSSQPADRVMIRLPDGMKALLAARAKAQHRSLSSEALALIERGIAAETASSQP